MVSLILTIKPFLENTVCAACVVGRAVYFYFFCV
jgi:hypothetical protein